MKKINLIGQKFGVLTVLKYVEDHILPNGRHYNKVECLCDVCGNTHIKFTNTLHNECICPNLPKRKSHGKSNTPLYNVWYGIKQRCYYKKHIGYERYGGRGIAMCDDWRNNFQTFYDWSMSNGYKNGLQIDRIDNDGNYEPSNCRWVDKFTNANNKSTNITFTHDSKTMSLKAWCRYLNISYKTCMTRYYRGHTIDECLNLVPLKDGRNKTPHNAVLYEYEDKLYSIKNLAEQLNMPKWKLYRDLKKGILPKGVTKHNE